MPITLNDFSAAQLDYIAKHNANNAILTAAVNSLEAQILASVGPGSQLILDLWDRDGIVGSHSHVLDLENYAGQALITIGRRPAPVFAGEKDESVVFGTFGGVKERVVSPGDVILNAAAITTGLPKDIFVGVGSSGIPQLFEVDTTPNVVYMYSMCWNGFSLTGFKRIGHILPAYPLIQAIAAAPRQVPISDEETNWLNDINGATQLVLPGAKEDNAIDLDGSVQVLGFFFAASKTGGDGWQSIFSGDPTAPTVKFQVQSEGKVWSESDFEVDAGAIPDQQFKKIDLAVVGDDRFVTTVRAFELVRTFLGPAVVSARSFIWGLYVKPIVGIAIPKDNTKVIDV